MSDVHAARSGFADALVCPECGEPAVEAAPAALMPDVGPALGWSHGDGEPLCPVMTAEGYRPAEPVRVAALWDGLAVDQADAVREFLRDVDEAVQVAADEDVVYGDGTAGPVRLVRDPYDVLAEHYPAHRPAVDVDEDDLADGL